MNLKNKKLLLLGGDCPNDIVVKRAQKLGIYVIVTDYHTDYKLSPAKKIANEAWDISWSELDILEKKCKEIKIDGVLGGFSEFKVEYAIKLSKRLGLPNYCTEKQLEITRDKVKFKNECKKYNLPVVPEYSNLNEIEKINGGYYPLIVKPVDRAGSIGIKICRNREELIEGYNYALNLSKSKNVIIEKYMENCKKIDLYYIIKNKEIKMIFPSESLLNDSYGDKKIIQDGWIHSDKYLNLIITKVDKKIRKMLKEWNLECGVIFISTFIDQEENIYLFECGYRLEGGITFVYTDKIMNYNYLDMLLNYILTGKYEEDSFNNINITLNVKKVLNLNFYLRKGKINFIEGVDKIKNIPEVIECVQYLDKECETKDEGVIYSKFLMVIIEFNNQKELIEIINKINTLIKVEDKEGNDMIINRMISF